MRTDEIVKRMAHFKSTFTTIKRFSEILKCSQTVRAFLSQHSRAFRDRLPHVQWRVETESRLLRTLYVRITSIILRTVEFLCVLYAEICVNATAEMYLYNWLVDYHRHGFNARSRIQFWGRCRCWTTRPWRCAVHSSYPSSLGGPNILREFFVSSWSGGGCSYGSCWSRLWRRQKIYTSLKPNKLGIENWTNLQWLAVVWTLIYHDLRHHMVKMVWTDEAQPSESATHFGHVMT